MIQLDQLKKIFSTKDSDVHAVDDVSLSIKEGEIFGIIGYSGAGKSTLIRLLNALEKPTSGTVTVAGKELSQLNSRKLREARQDISMIFQHFNLLWSRTVRANVAFPLEIAGVSKRKREARVNELLELVGLQGRGNSYPSQLSGGQKQRVGIARALANNPKVLLCDEATSALDPKTTNAILDLLIDINEKLGLTIVLITHEMHVIRKICHRVAVMEEGQVVEQGHVLDVFQNPQQEITKEFVKQVADPEETEGTLAYLQEKFSGGVIAELTFIKETAQQPLLSKLLRQNNIEVNILKGKVAQTRNASYGILVLQLTGPGDEIDKALDFVRESGVKAEVINDDRPAVSERRLG